MFSGRHLLFLGVLACLGLVSVRDGQKQVELAYGLAAANQKLQKAEQEAEVERARLQSLRVPTQVVERIQNLRIPLSPPSDLDPYATDRDVRMEGRR